MQRVRERFRWSCFFFPIVSKRSSAVKQGVCNLHMRLFLGERRTTHGQSMFSSFNAAINIWEVNQHPVVFPIRVFNKIFVNSQVKGQLENLVAVFKYCLK